jgi:hypothetical protein
MATLAATSLILHCQDGRGEMFNRIQLTTNEYSCAF